MTALQNQFNQLLVDQAKLRETERANRAHEDVLRRQAGASETQAAASQKQASIAEGRFMFGKEGPLGVINEFLGNLLKSLRVGGHD